MRRHRLAQLLGLLALAVSCVEPKGGGFGGFGGGRVRTSGGSRTGARTTTRASTNPAYKGHPRPMRSCVGCYYGAGGMYYDRTFMYMYLGMEYSCVGCRSRSNADVDSLTMSISAVKATAAVDFSSVWYSDDILTPGSAAFTEWAAELGTLVSSLTDGKVPPASCLATALTPRAGFADAAENDGELQVTVMVTLMLESEDADAAAVVAALQDNCVGNTGAGGSQLGHWVLPHCLTGVEATTVQLTSELGEEVPPATSSGESSGFGDLLLSLLMVGLGVWCCASAAERHAESAQFRAAQPTSRRPQRYGQINDSDDDDDNDGRAGESHAMLPAQSKKDTGADRYDGGGSRVIAVEAQPVVQAVAVAQATASVKSPSSGFQ